MQADRPTSAWFYNTCAFLIAAEALPWNPDLVPLDPLVRWHQAHSGYDAVHTGKAMLSETSRHFHIALEERTSYLYRYFCGRLPPGPEGRRLADRIFQAEEDLLGSGVLRPVGLRFIGKKASPSFS